MPGKVIKESLVKEESHVDVSTRARDSFQRKRRVWREQRAQRDFGHAVA